MERARSEAREGTAEECAGMHDQAVADLAAMQAQVGAGVGTGAGTMINVSGGAGVSTEP